MLSCEEWIKHYCEHPHTSGCSNCIHNKHGCVSWMKYRDTGDLSLSTRYKNKTNVFKIQRMTDGLFKLKGNNKLFDTVGGVWRTKGLARSHITMNGKDRYKDCAIVEYELTEVGVEYIV